MNTPKELKVTPDAIWFQTPWGCAINAWEHTPGLIFVKTPRHGGYWCSPERWAQLKKRFPMFAPFGDRAPWLEEDIDAALPPLVWPELYEDQQLFNAVRTVVLMSRDGARAKHWGAILQWLQDNPEAKEIAHRATMFSMDQCKARTWERGGLSSGPDDPGWWVHLTQYPNGEQRTLCFRDYPQKQFYTDEELKELVIPDEEIQRFKQERARNTRLQWHAKYANQ